VRRKKHAEIVQADKVHICRKAVPVGKGIIETHERRDQKEHDIEQERAGDKIKGVVSLHEAHMLTG
jgi:hypothetical protein